MSRDPEPGPALEEIKRKLKKEGSV